MTDAISDGLSKAQFLASKVGANLGPAQSVVEDGGYISCSGEAEYLGEEPDFGWAPSSLARVPLAAASAPVASRPALRHRHYKKPTAKKATVAARCTLSAQVSLAYVLN
jgi:hypothetical protein